MRLAVPTLATAAALAATASAGPRLSVTVSKAPATLRAETRWDATVTVRRGTKPVGGAAPQLTFRNGLTRRIVAGVPTRRRGRYRARVSLPFGGRWVADVHVAGRPFRVRPVRVLAPRPVASILPSAEAFPICGGEGSPLPQYAVALDGASLWIACRNASELRRVDTASGETWALLPAPGAPAYSIAAGGGAVWAATRSGQVTRVDTANGGSARLPIEGTSAYLWHAAGSLWVADDARSMLVRIDPATRRVLAEIRVGDGAAGFVTDGQRAWVVNHRDATLDRIDLATNAVTRLATLPGEAPERITLGSGSLWITGRGTDLLRVDPQTGAVETVVEIGAGGTDVAAASGRIWVTAAGVADDRSGLPVLERLLAVDPATNAIVETIAPTGRLVVDGTASDGQTLWIADVVGGRLYRLARG
jgi:sugar lactone lactonase YvrE